VAATTGDPNAEISNGPNAKISNGSVYKIQPKLMGGLWEPYTNNQTIRYLDESPVDDASFGRGGVLQGAGGEKHTEQQWALVEVQGRTTETVDGVATESGPYYRMKNTETGRWLDAHTSGTADFRLTLEDDDGTTSAENQWWEIVEFSRRLSGPNWDSVGCESADDCYPYYQIRQKSTGRCMDYSKCKTSGKPSDPSSEETNLCYYYNGMDIRVVTRECVTKDSAPIWERTAVEAVQLWKFTLVPPPS
jgi:hypothetical protein